MEPPELQLYGKNCWFKNDFILLIKRRPSEAFFFCKLSPHESRYTEGPAVNDDKLISFCNWRVLQGPFG